MTKCAAAYAAHFLHFPFASAHYMCYNIPELMKQEVIP